MVLEILHFPLLLRVLLSPDPDNKLEQVLPPLELVRAGVLRRNAWHRRWAATDSFGMSNLGADSNSKRDTEVEMESFVVF